MQTGKEEGRIGPSNSWPIDMLQKGDVYIADGFGKVADGTLIGDNLGNAIYAKTGTGVVFDAGARDLDGLQEDRGVQRLRPRLGPLVPARTWSCPRSTGRSGSAR